MAERLIAHGARIELPAAIALGRDRRHRAARSPPIPAAWRRARRWGALIVRAAERAPASVIEALVALGASRRRDRRSRRPRSTASAATPRSTPRRGTATPAPPTRCCASAPTRACATASTSATPLGWADFAGRTATPAIASSRPTSTCSTSSPAARRRGSPRILDADPAALGIGRSAAYGGDPGGARVTPLAWAMERDKPEMAATCCAPAAPDADAPCSECSERPRSSTARSMLRAT